jgi:hypothetical protein
MIVSHFTTCTTYRKRVAGVATIYLDNDYGLVTGTRITVDGLGGTGYNTTMPVDVLSKGTETISGTGYPYITYANEGSDNPISTTYSGIIGFRSRTAGNAWVFVGPVDPTATYGITVGDTITISGLSGTGYNSTVTVTLINTDVYGDYYIQYTNAGVDEAKTADTGDISTVGGVSADVNGSISVFSGVNIFENSFPQKYGSTRIDGTTRPQVSVLYKTTSVKTVPSFYEGILLAEVIAQVSGVVRSVTASRDVKFLSRHIPKMFEGTSATTTDGFIISVEYINESTTNEQADGVDYTWTTHTFKTLVQVPWV